MERGLELFMGIHKDLVQVHVCGEWGCEGVKSGGGGVTAGLETVDGAEPLTSPPPEQGLGTTQGLLRRQRWGCHDRPGGGA